MLMSLSPFLIVIPLMYFLMIRPQKKAKKSRNAQQCALGDEITTIGGITGRVLISG